MGNICLCISYDGSQYRGFQTQSEGNTIQDKIEEALLKVTGERIRIHGSGRTDAGVHARTQFIHFSSTIEVPIEKWPVALNCLLPDDIVVQASYQVPPEFHSRISAKSKTYKYTVNYSQVIDVFQRHMQYHYPRRLKLAEMEQAALYFVGEHDFTSFSSVHSSSKNPVRTIHDLQIVHSLQNNCSTRLEMYVTGNGFLQHMVRIIMGTLLDVGTGKKRADDIPNILSAKNRLLAGPTAPPHGLVLWDVIYPEYFGIAIESLSKQ
jgi:tRNA pseudouridine38-40 synthase